MRAPPLPRTHASYYADTAEQTTQSPGDILSAVCGRQAALSLRTHCPAHRWCSIRESTRPRQTRDICAVGSADARAFLELAVGPRPSGCRHMVFCSCGGNGGGRNRFQRRRGTCSSAGTSNNRKPPFHNKIATL